MFGHWFPPHSPCFTAHLFYAVGAQHGGIAGLGDCSVLCFMFGRIIFFVLFFLKLYVCNSHVACLNYSSDENKFLPSFIAD